MTLVPIKDLKSDLSTWAERAARGEIIQVTKYNRPYLLLSPVPSVPGLIVGSLAGQKTPQPALKGGTRGRALKALLEDREGR